MTHYPPPAPAQKTKVHPSKSPGRQRNTTLWWALVTLGTLVVCSLSAIALVATGGQLPDLSPGPSWTPPPSPSQVPDQSPAPAPGLFAPGTRVTNVSSSAVNLRLTPGYQGKPADDVIAVVPAGTSGMILDGPELADGLTWWRVRFGQQEGWMAERTSSGVLLLDLSP